NKNQTAELVQVLPKFPIKNIILEPLSKNTAPCIGLASLFIRREQPDAVMVVLPSDHLITDQEKFLNTLEIGIETAYKTGGLITIGIQPTYPSTGYGYIQFIEDEESEISGKGVYKVKTFAEKPDFETAKKFLESGDFLWNSGMFIWRVDVILDEIKIHLPDIYDELMKIDEAIETMNIFSSGIRWLTLSIVCSMRDFEDRIFKNCFGFLALLLGQNLDPTPPAIITANAFDIILSILFLISYIDPWHPRRNITANLIRYSAKQFRNIPRRQIFISK
ncbi:Nucleotidyl transferase, partial [Candidatus Kryptonium thompsonii]